MDVHEKLGRDVFKLDEEIHIRINHDVCLTQCKKKYCVFVCPAKVYSIGARGMIEVNAEGCLECGTCVVACLDKALEWRYPRAGLGVQYRFG